MRGRGLVRRDLKAPGHIVLAVMISDSKLPTADQERAVADVAKVVYEGWGQGREQARSSR